ncbi:MAG: hypothetical protein ACI4PU_00795 [Intestinibacter sp.]
MKTVKLLIIYLMAICVCGCSQDLKEDFSQIDNEKDAIMATFGEYNSTKGTGVVLINEKENEKDKTYIYYIVKLPALENYKKALKAESSTERQEQIVNEMYNKVEQEASEEVMNKIDKLYTNKNVDKIRIEVGVVWPYGKHNYTKPGENIVGKKIAYIKTFNFTRENYAELLKQYKESRIS